MSIKKSFTRLFGAAAAAVVLAAGTAAGAHSSGIFINANVSAGEREGDGVFWTTDEGPGFPDTSYYDFFYGPRYSFTAGYEYSFNKNFSARAALGYQNVAMIQRMGPTQRFIDGEWVPINEGVDETVERHWLTVPVEGKAMLPFRKSGVYLAAGPKISMLLASKIKDKIKGVEADLADSSSFINFQLGFRVGWETAIANAGYFYIETGYHTGLIALDPILYRRAKVHSINGNVIFGDTPWQVWRHPKKYREGESALGVGFRINFPTNQ